MQVLLGLARFDLQDVYRALHGYGREELTKFLGMRFRASKFFLRPGGESAEPNDGLAPASVGPVSIADRPVEDRSGNDEVSVVRRNLLEIELHLEKFFVAGPEMRRERVGFPSHH